MDRPPCGASGYRHSDLYGDATTTTATVSQRHRAEREVVVFTLKVFAADWDFISSPLADLTHSNPRCDG